MTDISYFLVFVFGISFSINVFSFVYATLVPIKRQTKFLTKQTIHFAIHLSLLLLVLIFFLTCIGLSEKTLLLIVSCSASFSGIVVGYALILILLGGFKYVTTQ